jgi:phosphatidate cytidylyltransferase
MSARPSRAAARAETRPIGNLASRLLVVAIGLPAVLGLLWLGGWWLFGLVVAAGALAFHEFTWIARPLRPLVIAGYAGVLGILLAIQVSTLTWALGALLGSLALAFLLKGFAGTRGSATVAVATTVLGAAWIGFGLGFMLLLRDLPEHGRLVSFAVLIAIFADDTLAYIAGRLLGRHKLAPALSPGKTVEGFVAGTAAAIFATFVVLYEDRDTFLSIGQALVLGVVIAIAAPMGDLFESMLKRDLRVKDTGRLLGGHGGVLDRVDSILFGSVAAYYTVLVFMS